MTGTTSLNNKVALVTGGSRGIGAAVAIELAKQGASVYINYNKSAEAAEKVVHQIQKVRDSRIVGHLF
jgi:NAD(P)-dependent dehydrogenase (short-subunit alcohol dehydrogenase family)